MKISTLKSSGSYNNKLTAAFFSSILATIFAGFYCLGRIGLKDNSIFIVFKVLMTSYFLLFLPCALRKIIFNFKLKPENTWHTSDAAFSLLGLFLIAVTGLIIPLSSFMVLLPFIFLGFIFLVINLIEYFSSDNIKNNMVFFLFSALFSILIIFIYSSNQGSTPPLLFEDLVREHSPADNLFHCAIAQMIKTYGIPSTGLDGVPRVPYHFGSHFIFAQVSKLLNLNIFVFYRIGFTAIFIPFLFNTILSFIIDLREYFGRQMTKWNLKTDYRFWMVFAVPFVGFLPVRVMNRLYTKEWIISSESYALGLAFFFIIASFLLYCFKKFNFDRQNLRLRDLVLVILVLPILIGIMGIVKQSLIFLLVIVLGYLLFRLKLHKNVALVFSSLATLALAFFISNLVTHHYPSVFKLVFFDQLRRFVVADKASNPLFWILLTPAFFVFHFFWSWLYIALRMREEGIKKIKDFKNSFRNKRIIDIEILLILCIIGAVPGMLLKVRGGVTGYFSDVQRWVAVGFLLSRFTNFPTFNLRLQTGKVRTLILSALIFIVVSSFLSNVIVSGKNTINRYIAVRNSLLNLSDVRDDSESGFKKFLYGLQKSLDKDRKYKMYKTLLELDKIPLSEKKQTLLFIPKSNRLYWDSLNPYTIPLIAPALTGVAMIGGLSEVPISNEFPLHQWCYYIYDPRSSDQLQAEATPTEVYSKALKKGFSKLIIIECKEGNTIVTKVP